MQHKLNILLVEDNRINQKLVCKLLEETGHKITISENGKAALTLLESESFDLILMDVQMPIIDGLEATRHIREREAAQSSIRQKDGGQVDNRKSSFRRVPIIALTAHALSGDQEMCLEAGMDDYVSKPIDPDELFEKIEQWTLRGIASDPSDGSEQRRHADYDISANP